MYILLTLYSTYLQPLTPNTTYKNKTFDLPTETLILHKAVHYAGRLRVSVQHNPYTREFLRSEDLITERAANEDANRLN